MAPGLDQKSLGNPVKSGQEITEAEEKSDHGGAFQSLPEMRVLGVAAVEQPNQRTESDEQDRPGMNGREGKNGGCAEKDSGNGASRASKSGDPGRGPRHDASRFARLGSSSLVL